MRVARDGHWTHIGYCTGETSVPWLVNASMASPSTVRSRARRRAAHHQMIGVETDWTFRSSLSAHEWC